MLVVERTTMLRLAALLILSASANAFAQSADDAAAPHDGLQAIIVVAQKRSENVQDVPIAISAISASTLEKNQELSTRDLQFNAPSLVYNQAATNAQPFLRGIGSDLVGPNLDPSVATYIDGVYISNSSSTVTSMFGVDNVAVLEGPQGTLFGRNAVGGAIMVQTLTPGDHLEAKVSGTYGNFHQINGTGYISGPLGEHFSAGLYLLYDQRNLYFHDLNPADPTVERRKGFRAKAVWTPTDFIKLTGSIQYLNSEGAEGALLRNIQPNALGYLLGATPVLRQYYYADDLRQYVDNKTHTFTLKEEVDLKWAKLIGISAQHLMHQSNANDLDGTDVGLLGDTGLNYSKQFSQELQLVSADSSKIKWILGAYYFHERTGYYPTAIISNLPNVIFPAPIGASLTDATVLTDSYAAFAQGTAPLDFISDNLRLTLGARYTSDRKRFSATGRLAEGYLGDGPQVGPTTVFPDSAHKWNKFTPKVTLDYRIAETLLYASFSKGFKGGAYNIASPSDPGPVNPESLNAYEIGSKSEFLDNRLRVNTSAYYYKFSDLQVQLVDVSAGSTTKLQNAAEGEAYGFEGTLTAAPVRNLELMASISLEHAKYLSFPNAASNAIGPVGNPSAKFDATGNDLQRAPKVIYSAGVDYTLPLSNGGSIDAATKWYHNGGFYWEPTNRFKQDAYTIGNASVGYTFPGDRLTVRGFVNNVTDTNYQTILLLVPVSIDVTDAPPRTYGVTVSWKY